MPTPLNQILMTTKKKKMKFEFVDDETKIHLDLLRPTFESPSTNNRDKCKHRHDNETPCNVRINDDICTTYSQINDSDKRPA